MQMLEEKEQQLNSLSCKRTVTWDKLSEMRRKVSRTQRRYSSCSARVTSNQMHGLLYVQFRELEQVVMEDREEQEKLRQEQERARAVTKVRIPTEAPQLRFSYCNWKR